MKNKALFGLIEALGGFSINLSAVGTHKPLTLNALGEQNRRKAEQEEAQKRQAGALRAATSLTDPAMLAYLGLPSTSQPAAAPVVAMSIAQVPEGRPRQHVAPPTPVVTPILVATPVLVPNFTDFIHLTDKNAIFDAAKTNLVFLEYALQQNGVTYEELIQTTIERKQNLLESKLFNLKFSEYQNLVSEYRGSGSDTTKLYQIINQIITSKPELNLVILEYLLNQFDNDHSAPEVLASQNLTTKQIALNRVLNDYMPKNLA